MDNQFPRGIEVVVAGLPRNDKGQLLLGRQPKWNNTWTILGGHLDPGEPIMEGAAREIEEETGITSSPVRVLNWGEEINPQFLGRAAHMIFFHCLLEKTGGTLQPNPEVSELRWFTPEEALKLDMLPAFLGTIKKYLESEGGT